MSASVTQIWRYPVKSVGGEAVPSVEVTDIGLAGDRAFGVYDLATDTVLTARRTPELLMASAHWDGEHVTIRLPDGTETNEDAELSRWLERDVELRAAAGRDGGTYEVPLDFEHDADWHSWQGPPDAWHDSARTRVSLLANPSLRSWNWRRFRANLQIDGAGEPGAENDWVGSAVSVGDSVELDVKKQVDRCVIVTRPQPGLDRDLGVLRTVNAELGGMLGIGALVTKTGTISVGDAIALN